MISVNRGSNTIKTMAVFAKGLSGEDLTHGLSYEFEVSYWVRYLKSAEL